ncbi:CaiB/BaiF CoA transferase family protein [Pseudochelatococcus sp. B33]
MSEEAALDGMVVVEFGTRVGVAICGSLLAQLGATVVLIEPPLDAVPPGGKSLWREQFAAGKLSLVPSGGHEDAELVDALLARSDVVLTSSDADPAALRPQETDRPDNVRCDISAFGTSGPYMGLPFGELQIQALSGLMDTTGFADGPPVPIGIPIADVLTGTYAASAVLAAHRARRLQGFGQRINMALFDCAFSALGSFLSGVLTTGRDKSRMGNRHPTVAPWNLYRSRDGWVLICAGNQTQWERLCGAMERPDLAAAYSAQPLRIAHVETVDQAIEEWTRGLSTEECLRRLVDLGVACGPIVPIDGHPREANLLHRQMIKRLSDPVLGKAVFVPGSPFRMSLSPGCAPARIPFPDEDRVAVKDLATRTRPLVTQARPISGSAALQGLRIIEIGQYTTAPLCARQLGHLGAEIIKVEQPGGDESRTWVPHINGRSVSFRLNNADKRSLVLDLRTDFGIVALRELIATADVLVENLKPGTLLKFGLSPEAVLSVNPRIVYCAITGFGAESLYPRRPAFDMVIQAMSGFMSASTAGAVPLKSGISTADTMGAEMAMVALLAALEYRDRTGKGQFIDLAMQDITAWLTMTAWNGADRRRKTPTILACADGYILIAAREGEPSRQDGHVREASVAGLTRAEAVARLAEDDIEAVPVLSVREASLLPHTRERGLWFTKEHEGARWPLLASPLRLEATPPVISHLAPAVDADGESILQALGLTQPSDG